MCVCVCGGERLKSGGLQDWRGLKCFWSHVPSAEKGVWEEEKRGRGSVCERQLGVKVGEEGGEERERRRARKRNVRASGCV